MTDDRTPRAAVTERALEAVRARAPEDVELLVIEDGADLHTVDFLIPSDGGGDVIDILPQLTERLQVVQVLSAGTDRIESEVPSQATLCSARGARDGPVAEWVLAALIGASTGTLACARERRWDRRQIDDLAAWTVLVVGMGSIGRLVERHLHALGTTVVGVAARARDDLHGVDELPALLRDADAVVVLTPLTDATRGMFGATELATMRDGAVLVNGGRGPVVNTDALLAEVATGRLRAVLDVTDPEPLPSDHPLWDAPGVLAITPHIAGDSPLASARAAELAGDQLARWRTGEPLVNVVRKGSA